MPFLWLLSHLRLKAALVHITDDRGFVRKTLALLLLARASHMPIVTYTFCIRGFSFVLNFYFLVELTLLSLSLLEVTRLKKVASVLSAG